MNAFIVFAQSLSTFLRPVGISIQRSIGGRGSQSRHRWAHLHFDASSAHNSMARHRMAGRNRTKLQRQAGAGATDGNDDVNESTKQLQRTWEHPATPPTHALFFGPQNQKPSLCPHRLAPQIDANKQKAALLPSLEVESPKADRVLMSFQMVFRLWVEGWIITQKSERFIYIHLYVIYLNIFYIFSILYIQRFICSKTHPYIQMPLFCNFVVSIFYSRCRLVEI